MTRLHPFAERDLQVECLMQGVAEEGPVTDEEVLQQSFADLCRHMMLNNGRALGKCLDAYRRAGHVLEQFTVQLPEKYIAERVTFEIDSNGILNVAAEDKGTGKSEKITITNDQGRLNEEQIQKMIPEGEEFADEDKKVKERVDARNAFDGYIHSMRSSAEGSGNNKGLSEKISSDEKETILDALKDARSWLDSNPEADVEEIKEKQKEVEGICAPIVSKYYGGGGGGGAGVGDDEEDFHDE
ncbi:unnamed protein product [Durusdinium trenchii]|uniref:Heat shock protein 70 n=1 Tax=Durusdinium trenchii TaxID=1381693 RepID=A0ABP0MQU8_9DINO